MLLNIFIGLFLCVHLWVHLSLICNAIQSHLNFISVIRVDTAKLFDLYISSSEVICIKKSNLSIILELVCYSSSSAWLSWFTVVFSASMSIVCYIRQHFKYESPPKQRVGGMRTGFYILEKTQGQNNRKSLSTIDTIQHCSTEQSMRDYSEPVSSSNSKSPRGTGRTWDPLSIWKSHKDRATLKPLWIFIDRTRNQG